jgi:outer membrane protein TolC
LDGGITDAQKKLKATQLKAEQQGVEVERYALRERINQLFIRVALLREQSKLFDISLRDLQARRERITAGVEFGTLLESELTKLEVRELELQAQQENLVYQLSGTINTLAKLTGTELSDDVDLRFPNMAPARQIPTLNRPEQQLFQLQREAILAQTELIEANRKPKLSAFAQAGVGYPNPLNILDNNIAPFGLIGAQFSWKITDWKKGKVDKELLALQALKVQNQEATFDFNLESREAIYLAEVDRLSTQIKQDEKIAQLQVKILNQLAAQLDEGVITSVDYITQVNTELRARQNLLIHQVELLKTQLEFWNERGGD